jgi:hypothetical protein
VASSLVGLIDSFMSRSAVFDEATKARLIGIPQDVLMQWRTQGLPALPTREELVAIAESIERPYSVLLDAALSDTGYRDVDDNPVARPWQSEMARLIVEQWGTALRLQREAVETVVKKEDPFTSQMPTWVHAPSLTKPHLSISIGFTMLDPVPHGTFSDHPDARAVIACVQRSSNPNSGVRANSWDRIPLDEEEEWVYASLGPRWFDYAYRANNTRMLLKAKPVRFVVFVTSDGEPFLAPGDFAWEHVAEGTTVRQKLAPRAPSGELRKQLVYVGDVVPVEHVSTGNRRIDDAGN